MNKDWWEDFFEDSYADFFLERDEKSLKEIKDFLVDVLSLKRGMILFDQCSGLGNISHILARGGVKTIGVELNGKYVTASQEIAKKENLSCEFFEGDALTFLPAQECDAAVSWYTSFGYDLDDETNKEMLKRVYESLKFGASFALDFHNIPFVLRQPQPDIKIKKNKKGEECTVTREAFFNLEEGSYASTWEYRYADGRVKRREGKTRLYLPHQLKSMLQGIGFKDVRFYGATDKSKLTIDSPRCLVIARK